MISMVMVLLTVAVILMMATMTGRATVTVTVIMILTAMVIDMFPITVNPVHPLSDTAIPRITVQVRGPTESPTAILSLTTKWR